MKTCSFYETNLRLGITELVKRNFVKLGDELAILFVEYETEYIKDPEMLNEITNINNELANLLDEIFDRALKSISEELVGSSENSRQSSNANNEFIKDAENV